MERFVIRQNIEHYPELLKITSDPAKRQRIEKLLRDEEAKLKKYDEDHKKNRCEVSKLPRWCQLGDRPKENSPEAPMPRSLRPCFATERGLGTSVKPLAPCFACMRQAPDTLGAYLPPLRQITLYRASVPA